jgi:uncharacterized protein (UPF0335 family)
MAKNISKSIRISDEVFDYIDQAPGKGFNEKFENIILSAKKEESEREERLAQLNESIQKKTCELQRLFDQYRYMDAFFRRVLRLQHELLDLEELLQKASGKESTDLTTNNNEKEI